MRLSLPLILCLLAFVQLAYPDDLPDPQPRVQELPDIRTIVADLEMPTMIDGPSAGLRAKHRLPAASNERVYHSLYLPRDWSAEKRWPILVELTGNGGYRNQFGDECSGRPEDACLGYGISAGCGEGKQSMETERYLKPLIDTGNLTFASTGFRNHSDRWTLRPSATRDQLRTWLRDVTR